MIEGEQQGKYQGKYEGKYTADHDVRCIPEPYAVSQLNTRQRAYVYSAFKLLAEQKWKEWKKVIKLYKSREIIWPAWRIKYRMKVDDMTPAKLVNWMHTKVGSITSAAYTCTRVEIDVVYQFDYPVGMFQPQLWAFGGAAQLTAVLMSVEGFLSMMANDGKTYKTVEDWEYIPNHNIDEWAVKISKSVQTKLSEQTNVFLRANKIGIRLGEQPKAEINVSNRVTEEMFETKKTTNPYKRVAKQSAPILTPENFLKLRQNLHANPYKSTTKSDQVEDKPDQVLEEPRKKIKTNEQTKPAADVEMKPEPKNETAPNYVTKPKAKVLTKTETSPKYVPKPKAKGLTRSQEKRKIAAMHSQNLSAYINAVPQQPEQVVSQYGQQVVPQQAAQTLRELQFIELESGPIQISEPEQNIEVEQSSEAVQQSMFGSTDEKFNAQAMHIRDNAQRIVSQRIEKDTASGKIILEGKHAGKYKVARISLQDKFHALGIQAEISRQSYRTLNYPANFITPPSILILYQQYPQNYRQIAKLIENQQLLAREKHMIELIKKFKLDVAYERTTESHAEIMALVTECQKKC